MQFDVRPQSEGTKLTKNKALRQVEACVPRPISVHPTPELWQERRCLAGVKQRLVSAVVVALVALGCRWWCLATRNSASTVGSRCSPENDVKRPDIPRFIYKLYKYEYMGPYSSPTFLPSPLPQRSNPTKPVIFPFRGNSPRRCFFPKDAS